MALHLPAAVVLAPLAAALEPPAPEMARAGGVQRGSERGRVVLVFEVTKRNTLLVTDIVP